MSSQMAEVVAAIQRAIAELSQRRSEALAAVDSARTAYSHAVGATQGSSRPEPDEAKQAIAHGILEAEKAAGLFDETTAHLQAYLASLDTGSAGTWVPTPGGQRNYGADFNRRYEQWVRTSTGGPATGSEYLVEGNGERAHFDATTVELRDGHPTEVLIDAKGHYSQFVDNKAGRFHRFFRDSPTKGIFGMMEYAKRQVTVADGRPVEWWCAEEEAADAFDVEFLRRDELHGRITAIHKPMPE